MPKRIKIITIVTGIIILLGLMFFKNLNLSDPDFDENESKTELNYNKKETTEIYRIVIEERRIKPDVLINCNLIPFLAYDPEYTSDGFEAPPPPPSLNGWYTYSEKLIRFFNSSEFIKENDSINRKFFSRTKDEKFLKKQIDSSKRLTERINLKDLFSDYNSNRTKRDGYHFYTPLFNKEKTQVYIQYDFYDGAYGNGFGVILIKENDTWKIVRTFGLWIS